MRQSREERDALEEVDLVLQLLYAGGDHDVLEHPPLQGPDPPVHHRPHTGGPLAVVEDGQLSKHLAHPQSAQVLARLDNLKLSLSCHIQIGARLTLWKYLN